MNAYNPKHPRVVDGEYTQHLRNQPCLFSGYEYSEMGGQGVDPAHISFGNYARGMKASDWNCIPLRHDIHLEFDKRQAAFTQDVFAEDQFLRMDALKALAQIRYLRWALDTGRDVEAALREIVG
jgi:hypothetical protein